MGLRKFIYLVYNANRTAMIEYAQFIHRDATKQKKVYQLLSFSKYTYTYIFITSQQMTTNIEAMFNIIDK